jgi:DNA-nicking Smr family endonuclease
MKTPKASHMLHSFEDLKALKKKRFLDPAPEKAPVPPSGTSKEREPSREDDEKSPGADIRLFSEAMAGVTPIKHNMQAGFKPPSISAPGNDMTDEAEILQQLKQLVLTGEGFIVSDTPEYREGTGYNVHPEIAKRLHRGEFSIQDHIDLHGYRIDTAQDVFSRFLKDAVSHGKTGVLIIHGRGLSSPDQPVLRNKVIEWLDENRWKKWIVAYASARSCDGGTGATYVLLRNTPLTKRFRNNNN